MLFLEKLAAEVLNTAEPNPVVEGNKDKEKDNQTISMLSPQVMAETLFDMLETIAKRNIVH